MKERHSLPAFGNVKVLSRHEAGHLLMLWLLDRQGIACGIADGCWRLMISLAKRKHRTSVSSMLCPAWSLLVILTYSATSGSTLQNRATLTRTAIRTGGGVFAAYWWRSG